MAILIYFSQTLLHANTRDYKIYNAQNECRKEVTRSGYKCLHLEIFCLQHFKTTNIVNFYLYSHPLYLKHVILFKVWFFYVKFVNEFYGTCTYLIMYNISIDNVHGIWLLIFSVDDIFISEK